MNSKIDQAILSRKVLITCGTGGVGKTTLSAAMAIRAALLGKKAVVLTIDPAKRLAHSLGLTRLSDDPTDLTPQLREVYSRLNLSKSEMNLISGSFSAVVPDTRRTFESFVHELAPNAALAQKVINNPIFQIFAKELSGTNEYMALERLLALYQDQNYDCIILDTPPTRNTLSFLEAPHLLSQFFDEKIIRWLVLPTNKLLASGMKKALGVLEGLTGASFMKHLFDFAGGLFEVQGKFTLNLKKITQILESNQVGFLLVTTPNPDQLKEMEHFINSLRQRHFQFEGVIFNRTLDYLKSQEKAAPGSTHPSEEWQKAYEILGALQAREQSVIDTFMRNPSQICAKLPELARDVHSLEDLLHVALAFDPNSHPWQSDPRIQS